MWDWWQRSREREREPEQGVDADLVLTNRKRRYLGWSLIGRGLLLGFTLRLVEMPEVLNRICEAVVPLVILVGVVLARWASVEWDWIHRPDPKEPPSILKGK